MDLSPLRAGREFRAIVAGELVAVLGIQLTAVAVPFQVYALTHSSLQVGLVSLAQLFPLLFCSLVGGSLVDAVDRRKLLIGVDVLLGVSAAGLAVNADLGTRLWPLYVFPAISAGLSGLDSSIRAALTPSLVAADKIAAANAMFQALFQMAVVVGPALAGLLLAGAGVHFIYWINVATMLAAVISVAGIAPRPPAPDVTRPGLRSVAEGFRFVRGRQSLQGAYVIDLNAMIFGMPRALFPALAAHTFGGGTTTLGFLYAAPGAGAFVGALTTGWVAGIRQQGRAVILAVIVWGAAIAAFGFAGSLTLALVLLAVAGWADVISAVFRSTIVQLCVPDRLRGRLSGLQTAVVAGGPRLGDAESGVVATALGDQFSVVSGGIACVLGALALARALPEFRRLRLDGTLGPVGLEPGDETSPGALPGG